MKQLLVLFLAAFIATAAAADVRTLLQLVDYVGVDYAEAVAEGEIINAAEYQEMQEFGQRIAAELVAVDSGENSDRLMSLAGDLQAAVDAKAAPATISAITQQMRRLLMTDSSLVLVPDRAPDIDAARSQFQTHCATCHGVAGMGDGPVAGALEPAPTDFTDSERAHQRSLFGLFNTITLGVDGTSMMGFSQLSDHERWSLAFYVGTFSAPSEGDGASHAGRAGSGSLLEDVALLSPAEWESQGSGTAEQALWYRQHPDTLFDNREDPLGMARTLLAASVASYQSGAIVKAKEEAITAYLEGFELAEAALANIDSALMSETERALMDYRHRINEGAAESVVERSYAVADALLVRSQAALGDTQLSPWLAFLSSLIILLREGLEAILVLAAMIAFLVRTGRRDALVYIHAGWVAALAAGGVTWAASTFLFTISGATREVTEGFTALLAAAVLFYVGFWMHGNANARQWNRFMQSQLQQALNKRSLWVLFGLSFLAVYREAFETVLFYQALWSQAGADAGNGIVAGGIAATVLLVLVTFLLARFGVRLPLRQFFLVGAYLMIILALIFAGKGVAALQEAGRISLSPVSGPSVDWLGLYPTLESLGLQLVLLVAGAMLVWRRFSRR